MSSSPVRGRISAVQFRRIRPSYFLSMLIFTMPSPFFRVTPLMSPTCTPEMRTLWPWPGVTACAVWKSALRVYWAGEMKGIDRRSLRRM